MNCNIIYYISKFVNFEEYKQLSLINNEIRKKLLFNIPNYIKKEFAINELLNEGYPLKLLELFNPIKLYNITLIKNKINSGATEYIDYINSSFFKKYPIIRGNDRMNRPYISFYYNNHVTTLFQRYTNDKIRWVTGGGNPFNNSVCSFDFDNLYYQESDTIKILSELLNKDFYIQNNIKYELNKIIK